MNFQKEVFIPKPFQELFGVRARIIDVVLILSFASIVTFILMSFSLSEWENLKLWAKWGLTILCFDITGGVCANLSESTKAYYRESAKRRLVYLVCHIQPFFLSLIFNQSWELTFLVWLYTMLVSLLVNFGMRGDISQRLVGGFASGLAVLILLLYAQLPQVMLILYSFYIVKLIVAFSVDCT